MSLFSCFKKKTQESQYQEIIEAQIKLKEEISLTNEKINETTQKIIRSNQNRINKMN